MGAERRIVLAIAALARNRRDIIDKQLYVDPAELARAALALRARRALPIDWDIWREWVEELPPTSPARPLRRS